MSPRDLAERLQERLLALSSSRRLADPRLRRLALWLAVAILLVGVALSLHAHPELLAGLDWRYALALLGFAIPLMLALNVVEYHLIGRLLGKRIAFREACEVTLLGSAANMLPLPGGMVVRMLGLKAAGAGFGQGAGASLLVFAIWSGLAAVYSGAWILVLGTVWLGLALLLGGFAALVLAALLATRFARAPGALALIAATRVGLVLLTALRLFLCLAALGIPASFAQASGLTVTGVLSAAVSLLTAGLGARELFAAVFSPAVGLAMSVGFLATLLNRVLSVALVLPLTLLLTLARGRRRAAGPAAALLPRSG